MSPLLTLAFWLAAVDRAIRTFAQALLSVLLLSAGAAELPQVGIHTIGWPDALSVAALAAVLSVLTSISTAGTLVPRDARRAAPELGSAS